MVVLYPSAPTSGEYKADGLSCNAAVLRQTLGDEAFFKRLNCAAGTGSGGGCWRNGCCRGGRSSRVGKCRSPMFGWRGSEGGSR